MLVLLNENVQSLRAILKDLSPVHRQTPQKLSFIEIPEKIDKVNGLYLGTDLEPLDILNQITGVGDFERVKSKSIEIQVFGHKCKVISIDDLIDAKKAIGRNKDLLVVEELEEIKKKEHE
jgi:hypothetical protein